MPRRAELETAGRCLVHPGSAAVGSCDLCGRAVCVSCGVPIRGELIGRECLALVLDAAVPPPQAPMATPRGDRLALAGFGLVVLLSVLPWSRFGPRSGFFEAWIPNWSLLAVAAAVSGVGFVLFARWRRFDARLQMAVNAALAVIVWGAALLYHRYPPDPVSSVAPAPSLVIAGAALALMGALLKMGALLRVGRRAI